jgi:2-dehydro-3-deoxyphosphooctonate aldolase (KDO 8-P synthase)
MFKFSAHPAKPYIIAGPCTAESYELMCAVAEPMMALAKELDFTYIFKGSFDKANRTSVSSYRGPGVTQACEWFKALKKEFGCYVTTDIHETAHVPEVGEAVDLLQIPAFLCRQTDLIVAAVATKKAVSVKKGQFLAPESCKHITSKVVSAAQEYKTEANLALIERGSSFGYNNLVVDMRGLKVMAETNFPVIFDITHSTQQPSGDSVTGGLRSCAPLLARAAASTGYLSGFFLEVHTDPKSAKSDAATQLTVEQAKALLKQCVPILRDSQKLRSIDGQFQ